MPVCSVSSTKVCRGMPVTLLAAGNKDGVGRRHALHQRGRLARLHDEQHLAEPESTRHRAGPPVLIRGDWSAAAAARLTARMVPLPIMPQPDTVMTPLRTCPFPTSGPARPPGPANRHTPINNVLQGQCAAVPTPPVQLSSGAPGLAIQHPHLTPSRHDGKAEISALKLQPQLAFPRRMPHHLRQ